MRESRPYGSVRGACDETHVPTATTPRVQHAARRRGGRLTACAGPLLNRLDRVPRKLDWSLPTEQLQQHEYALVRTEGGEQPNLLAQRGAPAEPSPACPGRARAA